MNFNTKKITKYTLPILSGILIGTSYIPFPAWAILFCFAPLWYFWIYKATSLKDILWGGFLTQFIFSIIGFHWIFHVSHEFGHIPYPISIFLLILFATLQHLFIPGMGWLVYIIRTKWKFDNPLLLLLLIASFQFLFEYYYPTLFQWHLGYTTFYSKIPIVHLADIIGFHGIGFLLLISNALVAYFFTFYPDRNKIFISCLFLLVSFLFLNFLGSYHGSKWNKKLTRELEISAIQANIGNLEKIYAEQGRGFQDYITDTFIKMSDQAIVENPKLQILVWPESAIPEYMDEHLIKNNLHTFRVQKVLQFLRRSQKIVITGAYSKQNEKAYNSLFVLGPQAKQLSPPYLKTNLLAFGEYTPFSDLFPVLKTISPAGEGFTRGIGPQTLVLNDSSQLKLGPQICYESLDPLFTQQEVLTGAQVLVNLTNDSWFGPYSEPYQHLYMTLARAIENRRPLVRSTNTGFTTAIEASGEILALSPLFTPWIGHFKIHYSDNPPLTFFTRYGHYLPLIVLIFIIGVIGCGIIQRNKKS